MNKIVAGGIGLLAMAVLTLADNMGVPFVPKYLSLKPRKGCTGRIRSPVHLMMTLNVSGKRLVEESKSIAGWCVKVLRRIERKPSKSRKRWVRISPLMRRNAKNTILRIWARSAKTCRCTPPKKRSRSNFLFLQLRIIMLYLSEKRYPAFDVKKHPKVPHALGNGQAVRTNSSENRRRMKGCSYQRCH